MRRLLKKLVISASGILVMLAAASSADAQSDAEVFDSCKPHEWDAFAAAVSRDDMPALRRMMDEPEMRPCDALVATVRVLVCDADPLACVAPAAGNAPGGDVPPPPPTCPPGAQNCVPDEGGPPPQSTDCPVGQICMADGDGPPAPSCPPGAQNCVPDEGGLPPQSTDCPPGQICMAPPAPDPRFFGDAGPFPGQRPGQSLGIERDRNEPGNGANGGNPGGGGNGGQGGGSSTSGGGFTAL